MLKNFRLDILSYSSISASFPPNFFNSDFSLTLEFNPESHDGIKHEYAGLHHVNYFSLVLKDISELLPGKTADQRMIKISFHKDLINFDIGIIGLVALFKVKYPAIIFEIEIPPISNFDAHARFADGLAKIKFIYQQLTGIDLYTVKAGSKRKVAEPKDPLMIFLINKANFYDYFITTDSSWDLNQLFAKVDKEGLQDFKPAEPVKTRTNAESNYRKIRDLLLHYRNDLAWKNNNRNFYQEYIQMLSNFNILQEKVIELDKGLYKNLKFETFVKGGFGELEMHQLNESVRPIFENILEQPSFQIYLFCFLVNRNIGTTVIKEEKDDKGKIILSKVQVMVSRLLELEEFSRNLFLSVREIARNIIDHTESQTGILTGRVYNETVLPLIKDSQFQPEQPANVLEYVNNLNKKRVSYGENDFFELSVFDEGQDGLIRRTVENIEDLLKASTDTLDPYNKDIRALKEGKILLHDFFNTEEIKLHHHAIKTASHWGLIIFSNLIDKNDGYFSASSASYIIPNSVDTCQVYLGQVTPTTNFQDPGDFFATGTNYQIVFPLNRNHGLQSLPSPAVPLKENNFSAGSYGELLHYKTFFKFSEIQGHKEPGLYILKIIELLPKDEQISYRYEILLASAIYERIKLLYDKNHGIIPVLDFEGIADDFDQSRLLRLLAYLQLRQRMTNLIVANVKSDHIYPMNWILNIGSEKYPNGNFWNEHHFVLIFSYRADLEERRSYFTDILGGYYYKDLHKLRSKLSSTHKSLFAVYEEVKFEFSPQTLNGIKRSPLFRGDHSGVIQNFELVLKHGQKTYFELSLENTLNRDVYQDDLEDAGYKISDTHFRLGSKTHISEFIYAKRIFQNSFFSDRFAFLIVRYLEKNYTKLSSAAMTIIGYGDYSQLLVNRTTEVLRSIWKTATINNNLVSDVEQIQLLKQSKIHENVVVIVPINTTFSTAIKIENWIVKYFQPALSVPVNLILVSHDNLQDPEYINGLNAYLAEDNRTPDQDKMYPYKLFNWRYVDPEQMVAEVWTNPTLSKKPDQEIADILPKRKTEQKYFISIISRWSLPDDCENCYPVLKTNVPEDFPDYRMLERPLLETDKVSVTPDLLLDIPRNFAKVGGMENDYKDPVFLTAKSHRSGHIHIGGNHYLNYVDPYTFFEEYRPEIERWADQCKSRLLEIDDEIDNKSILLISPSNSINAYFVEFINKYVFNDAAIINHYEIGEDYVENFQKFFSHNIVQSDYIFFVDDFVHSVNTFRLINEFVRYCHNTLEVKGLKHKWASCSGLFTLINHANSYAQLQIINLLPSPEGQHSYFNFFQWKEDSIAVEKCPICKEKERYQKLADTAMLDTIKHYFINKVKNLSVHKYQASENTAPDGTGQWEKYHPLVIETSHELPWEDDCENPVKELWATYAAGTFPDKDYLKMLVQHSLNELLSDDDEVRGYFSRATLELEKEGNLDFNHKFLKLIISKLLDKEPFKQWIANFNPATNAVFAEIFKEIFIKVFTQQPFKNIKPLREQAFAWILIELTERLALFTNAQRLDFRDFRYIKFLLKRATVLGSNFVIDRRTFDDLRTIYQIYSRIPVEKITYARNRRITWLEEKYRGLVEEKVSLEVQVIEINAKLAAVKDEIAAVENPNLSDIHQEEIISHYQEQQNTPAKLRQKLAQVEGRIRALIPRIQYIAQYRNNIVYKDISLKDFSYYYVSLIKELTYNNESKIIKIEANADALIRAIDKVKERQFFFLLRLIKLENASLIKAASKIIIEDFVDKNWQIKLDNRCSVVLPVIKTILKQALNDYRLAPFRQFMGISDIDEWLGSADCKNFIHAIYLLEALRKEDEPNKNEEEVSSGRTASIKLEAKTDTILKNIYRMVCDPYFPKPDPENEDSNGYEQEQPGHGALLTLKFRGNFRKNVPPDDVIISNVFFSGEKNPDETEKLKAKKQKLIEAQVDTDTMSYIMLSGVSGYRHLENMESLANSPIPFVTKNYPLKPWTILELSVEETGHPKFWRVNRGTIFPNNNKLNQTNSVIHQNEGDGYSTVDLFFNEYASIDEEIKYIAFIRIAEISENGSEVRNEGKAVISLFTKEKEIAVERLRLALLISSNLDQFFKKHYEQDSLIAFMEERARFIEAIRLKHGFRKFLDGLSAVALDNTMDTDLKQQTIELCKNQLATGPVLANELIRVRDFEFDVVKTELQRNFSRMVFSGNQLIKEIKQIIKIVYHTGVDGEEPVPGFKADFAPYEIPEGTTLNLYPDIFKLLVTELIINAKKSQRSLGNDLLRLGIAVVFEDQYVTITFTNNYAADLSDGEIHRIVKGNFKYSSRGLGLVYRICEIFGTKPKIEIDPSTKGFAITIKLKTYGI